MSAQLTRWTSVTTKKTRTPEGGRGTARDMKEPNSWQHSGTDAGPVPSTPGDAASSPPLPNGANGRDAAGRFAKGNAGGPGNPNAKRVAALRSALLAAVTEEDIQEVVEALVREAKSGNVQATRELLSRVLGPPDAVDLLERIEGLEELLRDVLASRRSA